MPASDEQTRYWWCGGHAGVGHVVAETTYCQRQGQKVKALWFYLDSLDSAPVERPMRGLLIVGDAPIIPCTKCSNTTQWWSSRSAQNVAFEKLMARYPAMKRVP